MAFLPLEQYWSSAGGEAAIYSCTHCALHNSRGYSSVCICASHTSLQSCYNANPLSFWIIANAACVLITLGSECP